MKWRGFLGEPCRSCGRPLIDHGAAPDLGCPRAPADSVSTPPLRARLDALLAAADVFGAEAVSVHDVSCGARPARTLVMMTARSDADLRALAEQLGATPAIEVTDRDGAVYLSADLRVDHVTVYLQTPPMRAGRRLA